MRQGRAAFGIEPVPHGENEWFQALADHQSRAQVPFQLHPTAINQSVHTLKLTGTRRFSNRPTRKTRLLVSYSLLFKLCSEIRLAVNSQVSIAIARLRKDRQAVAEFHPTDIMFQPGMMRRRESFGIVKRAGIDCHVLRFIHMRVK